MACTNVKRLVPQVHIILGLRNPVERIFSHYKMMRREGLEPGETLDLPLAADAERGRPVHCVDEGYYAGHWRRCFQHFDRRRFHIYLFEEFVSQPDQTLRETMATWPLTRTFRLTPVFDATPVIWAHSGQLAFWLTFYGLG